MAVNERWGRLGSALALVALALARGVTDLGLPGAALLEPVFTLLAGVAAIGALAAWGTEADVPVNARAADLGGLALLALALVASAFGFTDPSGPPVALGLGYATLVVGATARATLGHDVARGSIAGAGATLLALGGSAWFVSGAITGLPTALAVGGAGLLVMVAVLDRDAVGVTVHSRSFQYGGGALLLSALAGALGIGLYALSLRYDHTWDLTRARTFTLSDHAAQVAGGLTFDVRLTAFYRPSTAGRAELASLVDKFRTETGRISVEWVDPLQEPRRAREAEVSGDQGTLLISANGHTRRLDGEVREDEFVRALVLLGSTEEHEVCWTIGHGEPDPDDEYTEEGLGVARLRLESLNYVVKKVPVANVGIPRTCAIVVVARPSKEWLPYEVEALVAYLAEGGRALVLLDAGDVPGMTKDFERLGISVTGDVVLDLNRNNQLFGVDDPAVVVLAPENYGGHPITRNLSAALVLPLARTVEALEVQGLEEVELLHTSPDAWGETDTETAPPTADPATERVGEIPLMTVVTVTDPAALKVAARSAAPARGAAALKDDPGRAVPADFAPKAGGRLVVIGDSDFASNQYLDLGNNRDLFLNSIAWLADEDAQIGQRPAASEKLTLSAVGQALWFLLVVVVVPGAAALAAVGTLAYRRYYL